MTVTSSPNENLNISWQYFSSYAYIPDLNVTTDWINESENCGVWERPSRITLQLISIGTLLLNLLAAAVIFRVKSDVRGKHVSFLFNCVRILNVLDIMQCLLLIFGPIAIPSDCNPDKVVCSVIGFFLASTALLSPLVVIVMAIDRAMAVYFHVLYKANPFLKIKYSFLLLLFAINGMYLFLPCVTDFSSYVAVPWLSLCFLEWGKKYRLYDLILAFYTLFMIMILIAANIAILVKIRLRKYQIQKMCKQSASSSSGREKLKLLKYKLQIESPQAQDTKKHHRSADDVIDVSCNEPSSFVRTSSLTQRNKKFRPRSLVLSTNCEKEPLNEGQEQRKQSLSPLLIDSNCLVSLSSNGRNSKVIVAGNKRPTSLLTPLTVDSLNSSSFPLFNKSPKHISPLVQSAQPPRRSDAMAALNQTKRASSVDDLFKPFSNSTTNRVSFPNPLLRQVLDYSNKPSNDQDNVSDSARSSDEMDNLQRNHSTSSFFSLLHSSSRKGSIRKKKKRKTRIIRKKVSRITKMTVSICLVFVILYIPFLARKLIQLIPSNYNSVYVPALVEIVTLFGPFLSPLCNPIVYVFSNPHYKKSLMQIYNKVKKIFSCSSFSSSIQPSKQKKRRSNSSRKNLKELDLVEDVFLPNNTNATLENKSQLRNEWRKHFTRATLPKTRRTRTHF